MASNSWQALPARARRRASCRSWCGRSLCRPAASPTPPPSAAASRSRPSPRPPCPRDRVQPISRGTTRQRDAMPRQTTRGAAASASPGARRPTPPSRTTPLPSALPCGRRVPSSSCPARDVFFRCKILDVTRETRVRYACRGRGGHYLRVPTLLTTYDATTVNPREAPPSSVPAARS
jgi:hypothetical protein